LADAISEWADKSLSEHTIRHGITSRELEVLQLVADGKTNHEIADALFISVPTVKRHLTNIFGKLGVASRAAAADYARTHLLT
jgi:DNA-binding NarL/FixJ family response regulator